jgi:hypothetical protein
MRRYFCSKLSKIGSIPIDGNGIKSFGAFQLHLLQPLPPQAKSIEKKIAAIDPLTTHQPHRKPHRLFADTCP